MLGACLSTSSAAYSERQPEVAAFATMMQSEHGFDRQTILDALAPIEADETVLRLITPPQKGGVRSWPAYRKRFIEPIRIREGVLFWNTYKTEIRRASEQSGVPEEIIVAIIGVETIYGRNTGNFEVLSALATLAFDYPARQTLFSRELENLFLLAREQNVPVQSYTGSFAGAIGYPQFLPSSIRSYAVDFDESGRIDLETSPIDTIGSVANFLKKHGWQSGEPVAVKARIETNLDISAFLSADITPTFLIRELNGAGIFEERPVNYSGKVALMELPNPKHTSEFWIGYPNFYVITRYNRSAFYAMSVLQLSNAIRFAQTSVP